jgi:sarcosine oxidase subunit gamma
VEFAVSGIEAAAVLGTGCSLDLRASAFPVTTCAQTRIDEVPVLIARATPAYLEILVERPLRFYLWCWLCRAAETL